MDTAEQAVQEPVSSQGVQTGLSTPEGVQHRKVILWDMVSLDGYFEGPAPGQIDWFGADEELENYLHSMGYPGH